MDPDEPPKVYRFGPPKPKPPHTVRHRDGGTVTIPNYTLRTAIRAMCTECTGHNEQDARSCPSTLCPLYPYRGRLYATIAKREPAP